MSEVAAQGWDVEIIPRHSKDLLILYKDGESRGSLEVFTQDEKDRWIRAIQEIDRPLSQKSTSERLINVSSLPENEPTTSGQPSKQSIPTSQTGT